MRLCRDRAVLLLFVRRNAWCVALLLEDAESKNWEKPARRRGEKLKKNSKDVEPHRVVTPQKIHQTFCGEGVGPVARGCLLKLPAVLVEQLCLPLGSPLPACTAYSASPHKKQHPEQPASASLDD